MRVPFIVVRVFRRLKLTMLLGAAAAAIVHGVRKRTEFPLFFRYEALSAKRDRASDVFHMEL
jgi:hypothetical protein